MLVWFGWEWTRGAQMSGKWTWLWGMGWLEKGTCTHTCTKNFHIHRERPVCSALSCTPLYGVLVRCISKSVDLCRAWKYLSSPMCMYLYFPSHLRERGLRRVSDGNQLFTNCCNCVLLLTSTPRYISPMQVEVNILRLELALVWRVLSVGVQSPFSLKIGRHTLRVCLGMVEFVSLLIGLTQTLIVTSHSLLALHCVHFPRCVQPGLETGIRYRWRRDLDPFQAGSPPVGWQEALKRS